MSKKKTTVDDLVFDAANVRTHNDKNKKAIRNSVKQFKAGRSILVDADNVIRAGNGTAEAWQETGGKVRIIETDGSELIAVKRTDLKGAEAMAYAIADNRASELAEWDSEILAEQLKELDGDFDIESFGFDSDDLSELMPVEEKEGLTDVDEIPEAPKDPVTKAGDLWILGDHRLLCGDSTKAEDVSRLMEGERAGLCFTSPPYGQQREYGEAKKLVSDWDSLMRGVFLNLPIADDGQVLVNLGLIHEDREWVPYWDEWIEWMRGQGWKRFGFYVWDKLNPQPAVSNGRLMASHEFVFHFCMEIKDPLLVRANKTAGKAVAGYTMGSSGVDRQGEYTTAPFGVRESVARVNRSGHSGHPAAFPVEFADYFVGSWDGNVYEPFCGSGTTVIACEQLNRKCYGMEIDPVYCDIIVKRWEKLTSKKATLEGK